MGKKVSSRKNSQTMYKTTTSTYVKKVGSKSPGTTINTDRKEEMKLSSTNIVQRKEMFDVGTTFAKKRNSAQTSPVGFKTTRFNNTGGPSVNYRPMTSFAGNEFSFKKNNASPTKPITI